MNEKWVELARLRLSELQAACASGDAESLVRAEFAVQGLYLMLGYSQEQATRMMERVRERLGTSAPAELVPRPWGWPSTVTMSRIMGGLQRSFAREGARDNEWGVLNARSQLRGFLLVSGVPPKLIEKGLELLEHEAVAALAEHEQVLYALFQQPAQKA